MERLSNSRQPWRSPKVVGSYVDALGHFLLDLRTMETLNKVIDTYHIHFTRVQEHDGGYKIVGGGWWNPDNYLIITKDGNIYLGLSLLYYSTNDFLIRMLQAYVDRIIEIKRFDKEAVSLKLASREVSGAMGSDRYPSFYHPFDVSKVGIMRSAMTQVGLIPFYYGQAQYFTSAAAQLQDLRDYGPPEFRLPDAPPVPGYPRKLPGSGGGAAEREEGGADGGGGGRGGAAGGGGGGGAGR